METAANFSKWTPEGFQQLTALVAVSPAISPPGARVALINCEGQPVRWRDDGTDPSGTVGMLMAVGDTFFYCGNLNRLRFIETAIGGIINISYYS